MVSNRKRVEDTARTNTAHDRDSEPIKMHVGEGYEIPEAITEHCEGVVGDEHRLNDLDNVDAIDEVFCELSVLWKCQIVQI